MLFEKQEMNDTPTMVEELPVGKAERPNAGEVKTGTLQLLLAARMMDKENPVGMALW